MKYMKSKNTAWGSVPVGIPRCAAGNGRDRDLRAAHEPKIHPTLVVGDDQNDVGSFWRLGSQRECQEKPDGGGDHRATIARGPCCGSRGGPEGRALCDMDLPGPALGIPRTGSGNELSRAMRNFNCAVVVLAFAGTSLVRVFER